ncbi:MAG: sugar transferase [Thiothrix sp.]|nr:MAG: sugar transferase [Thiothrix sp.]
MLWKKCFDGLAVTVGLILIGWVLILIALSIWMLDGRPILFRQQRLGLNKQPFSIYKFRTMQNEVVTKSGKVLRQTGLDELAQILNIIKGDMSVVGPRPLTQADITRLGWDDAYHAKRWAIKPGITGLAQLYGGRSAKVSWQMDKVYQAQMSWWLDMRVVLWSLAVNVLGKRRVRTWLMRRKLLT